MTCRRRYFSASACGSSRVLMIGRLRVVALETPSQMCSARWLTRVRRAARRLGDLAGADDDLAGHQERDQHVGEPAELAGPADQVVLVAAVGVAGGVGVVLEQVDLAGDALVVQPLLGVEQQPLEDPLPRLVVGDQLDHVVALGRGVLRVAADVEVEPGAVAQEDVAAAPPADHLAEQVARHLVRAQPALALERARDAVLVLDPEDPPVHAVTLRRGWCLSGDSRRMWLVAVWSPTATNPAQPIMRFATIDDAHGLRHRFMHPARGRTRSTATPPARRRPAPEPTGAVGAAERAVELVHHGDLRVVQRGRRAV